jgi:hypothetical protein
VRHFNAADGNAVDIEIPSPESAGDSVQHSRTVLHKRYKYMFSTQLKVSINISQ